MARRPRVFIPGYPHHVVQRGHDRKAVFVEPAYRGAEAGQTAEKINPAPFKTPLLNTH